jgi:N-acetylmuramic acid 6-phosphate etherase
MDPGELVTEAVHAEAAGLHRRTVGEILRLINAEDATAAGAVGAELDAIAAVTELVIDRLGQGGRLFYVGAGTSGRLGVLDASECPPTFGVGQDVVQGIIAGGAKALVRAAEGAEDDLEAGGAELARRGCERRDVVIGLSASGRTPYVMGALQWAKSRGIATATVSCNRPAAHDAWADIAVNVVVGPEVLAGSTRMKCGTAQKMVLNMISTAALMKLGHAEDGRMVRLRSKSNKLRTRATQIIIDRTGADRGRAEAALRRTGGDLQAALEWLEREA